MCVLGAERERDTSPSRLYMNHVYYIRRTHTEREREREVKHLGSTVPICTSPSKKILPLLLFLPLILTRSFI